MSKATILTLQVPHGSLAQRLSTVAERQAIGNGVSTDLGVELRKSQGKAVQIVPVGSGGENRCPWSHSPVGRSGRQNHQSPHSEHRGGTGPPRGPGHREWPGLFSRQRRRRSSADQRPRRLRCFAQFVGEDPAPCVLSLSLLGAQASPECFQHVVVVVMRDQARAQVEARG